MATYNELIGYTGSKELGQGTNSEVPVIDPNANLNPIMDTGKNIMLLDADRNMKIFQQKIADRDKRLELFDKGQIASGNILDQDKPDYEASKKKVNDAFDALIDGGGLNNPKLYAAYQDAITEHQNTVTHAQERWAQAGLLKDEIAKERIPSKRAEMQKHYDDELKKDFNQFIDPHQALFDLNVSTITDAVSKDALTGGSTIPTATTDKTTTTNKGGNVSTTQTQTTAPVKGKATQDASNIIYKNGLPYNRTTQHTSLNKMRQNATNLYLNPEGGAQIDALIQKFQTQIPTYEQKDDLNHLIQRAEDYNKDNGYVEGRDPDAAPVSKYKKALGYDDASHSVMPNPVTGKYDIGLDAPEFSTLWTLAQNNGSYVSHTDTYMEKEAAQSEKDLHDRAMEGIGWAKTNAYANWMKYKLSQAKTKDAQNQVMDGQYLRNYDEQQNLITKNVGIPKGGAIPQFTFNTIPANKSLPLYTIEGKVPTQLKPFDAEEVHSLDPIKDPYGKIIGYPKGDKVTYKGGYFKPVYISNGNQINTNQLQAAYNNYIKQYPKYEGDEQDFLKKSILDKTIQVQTQGENGATDLELNNAAQRIIHNLDDPKQAINPFGDGTDNPPPDEPETTTESTSSNNASTVTQ